MNCALQIGDLKTRAGTCPCSDALFVPHSTTDTPAHNQTRSRYTPVCLHDAGRAAAVGFQNRGHSREDETD